MKPLVSVICLCYNHERFVEEALNSVFLQTYSELEIIVVDDFSSDQSREIIRNTIAPHPQVILLENKTNIGNCKSFNTAFQLSKGKYIIDFATDDVMYPHRIEQQVEAFEKLDKHYGVLFTNALNITEEGKQTTFHYKDLSNVPSGNVYKKILQKYFISPPTMMIRKSVLDELGGYDESLAYEDFDFWVRSARKYNYFYLNEALTKRRVSSHSHSSKFDKKGFDPMAETTYRVIQKALWLNKNRKENKALAKRIRYELRHAFYMEKFYLVKKYYDLLKEMNEKDHKSSVIAFLSKMKLPVFSLYKIYKSL